MKSILSILSVVFISTLTVAQVGINSNAPGGMLDIDANTGFGFVYPVVSLMNETTQTINNPNGPDIVAGTTVYNDITNGSGTDKVYPGLYFWDGNRWIPQFNKKDNKFFIQTSNVSTGYNQGAQTINFEASSFTPLYDGKYRIQLTVHFGAGQLEDPDEISQFTNYGAQEGEFNFTFNGTIHTFSLGSYSGNNADDLFVGNNTYSEYENEFSQLQLIIEEPNLEAGTIYNFSLTFDQLVANGFISDGLIATDGEGNITIEGGIRCSLEINYVEN